MKDEIAKIREEQNANLLAILKAQNSNYDPDKLGQVINKPSSNDQEIPAKKDKDKKKVNEKDKKSSAKKLRFDYKEDNDEESAEYIRTNSKVQETKGMSMFNKVPIKRGKLVTPKGGINSLEEKLKEKDIESSGSIPYSDNFEPDESLAASKAKGLYIKTKSDIGEDIEEEYEHDDEIKDTITERIGDYSMGFEEISESIAQSKTFGKKSKHSDSKQRLNSRYSGSRISEEDMVEDIEESIHAKSKDHDEDYSSSHTTSKMKTTKPKHDVSHKNLHHKDKFPQNKLIEKLQESSMNDFINTITKGIEAQYKEEHGSLVREYSDNRITETEYARRKHILDEWKDKEMKDIAKKKMLIEGWVQMNEIVAKMKNDEESIGHSSGSIKDLKKAPKYLFSKPDYKSQPNEQKSSDSELDRDEDDSNDSLKVRLAKKQIRDLVNFEDEEDSANEHIEDEAGVKIRKKSTKKKKLAANKLFAEKEKAIQEGLKQKMLELEEKHAKNLLDEALKIDVKKEIEKRFNMILEIDNEQAEQRRRNEVNRQKKLEESMDESSIGYKVSKITDNRSIDIDKHTDNDESVTSTDFQKLPANRNKPIQPSISKEDTIKEDTIQESLDDYNNDFGSITHSHSNVALKPPFKKLEEKKSPSKQDTKKVPDKDEVKSVPAKDNKIKEESEIESDIEEEYSVDFEESNQSSSHFNQSIKSAKNNNKDSKLKTQVKDEIKEAESDEEDDKKKPSPTKKEDKKLVESASGSIIEDTPEDTDNDHTEEIVHRIPTGKSDDYFRKITDSASSADLEVLDSSHKSVDWVLEVPIEKPETKKPEIPSGKSTKPEEAKETPKNKKKTEEVDDIDEEYEDDFENSSDKSEDKESTPRVGGDSNKSEEIESSKDIDEVEEVEEKDIMDDHEKLADIIAEELFKSIDVVGLFDHKSTKLIPPRDIKLENFQNKFPFKKTDQPRVDNKMEMQCQIDFFNELGDEVLKSTNMSEIIKKVLKPKKYNFVDELQKLRVEEGDEINLKDTQNNNFISEKIFKAVNDRSLKRQKNASKEKLAAIEAHNRALYNSFNDVFTKMIPIGLKENPHPWIVRDQAFRDNSMISDKVFTENNLRKLVKRVKQRLTEIIRIPQTGKDNLNAKPANPDDISTEEYNEKEVKRKKKIMEENL